VSAETGGADIGGWVAPGYEQVREEFGRNFDERDEVGATFAVYAGGSLVVDLWGGTRDAGGSEPYTAATLQLLLSSTAAAPAACAHLLAQRGLLDLEAPVAEYWPEFGQAGKDDVPVRWLLAHQVGLPAVDAKLTATDVVAYEPVITALERQVPLWEPGTAHGYHAITFGFLVGEVVRRIDGRSLGAFFHDEIARPLGLDFWIGLPTAQDARVAPMDAGVARLAQIVAPDSLLVRAVSLDGALRDFGAGEDPQRFRAAEVPSVNGIANARALARFYAGVIGPLDGGPPAGLLTNEQISLARVCQTSGLDRVLTFPGFKVATTIGLGFWTSSVSSAMGGAGSFGAYAMGGSLGFADPEHGLAVGYVTNKMRMRVGSDPRSSALVRAAYDAAGAVAAFV
jgi:CubicO group peptidase (beta-lactamase class C family)